MILSEKNLENIVLYSDNTKPDSNIDKSMSKNIIISKKRKDCNRFKNNYKDIYALIKGSGFESDYVKELHQFTPNKITIKIKNTKESVRFYWENIMELWIQIKEFLDARNINK